MDPFSDSFLRLGRAHEQFKSLDNEVAAWLARKTYSLSVRRDSSTGEDICEVGEIEPVPATWSLIASEIVHHFRSALDNAVQLLTIFHSGAEMKGTEFPVFMEKSGFESQGERKMRGLRGNCKAYIESVQPFHKQNPEEHVIWNMHELCNANKHQSLSIIEVFREIEKATVGQFGGVEAVGVRYGHPGRLKTGTEIARWQTRFASPGQGQVQVDFRISRQIALDVPRPPMLNGQPLIPAIKLMGDITHAVVCGLQQAHLKDMASNIQSP